jgi:hypothetical protein
MDKKTRNLKMKSLENLKPFGIPNDHLTSTFFWPNILPRWRGYKIPALLQLELLLVQLGVLL